ncbi:cupin domain-containing protein [Celeribacter neptunius]|uniref:Transcriptional regulator, contains XRE-family HTH domain n=1 Tax=Celeribacter neptunius TaxID=588602 RepID=A0A1I3L2M9_9RHOB|nr:cupin domain-containing protein [Celeribacter neptunius]SFI78866.1 Transcriptional regulator, contains XRE-family HTH domain [Celeribacter neptunius]
MEFDVGARLKEVRKAKGLSQRVVAERSGVTNGMISLIESNKSSPSVSSLKKILTVLDIALADFFESETPEPKQFVFRPADFVEINPQQIFSSDDEPALEALSIKKVGNSSTNSLLLLYEVYEAGADTGAEALSHEGEEGGFVIEGKLLLEVDGETQVLKAGDAYLFDSTKPHRFRNVEKERCVIVNASTPPTF